jgi:hypothetical protein
VGRGLVDRNMGKQCEVEEKKIEVDEKHSDYPSLPPPLPVLSICSLENLPSI